MHIARLHLGRPIAFQIVFGRQLLWYTKCGDSCNSPEACESPCYCQHNSAGGASQKGNSQTQNMWGTCRPQSGLLHLLVPWCYEATHVACGNTQGGLSSCCVLFSLSIIVDPMDAKADQQLGLCLPAQQTARHKRASRTSTWCRSNRHDR